MNSIEKAIQRLMKQAEQPDEASKSVARIEQTESTADLNIGTQTNPNLQAAINKIIRWDFDRLESMGYVTPQSKQTNVAEELRVIKRPLVNNALGRSAGNIPRGNTLMVTSSLPGEGKTFMSLNLALSIVAEKDTTVLLMDGDLVNPTMSRLLGVEDQLGLTDVLDGSVGDISEVILQTDIPELRFIPAGRRSALSTELLASEKMHNLIDELSTRYKDRIIIFDSSPVLVTSLAIVLSHLVGQIALVVEAGKTPHNILREVVDLLNDNDVVNLILNKNRRSSLGGYYYGSYYGSGNN